LPSFPKLKRKGSLDKATKCESCGSYIFKDIECSCKSKNK
jgi:hypothetical protein